MSSSNNSSTNSSINSGSDNTNTVISANEKNKLIFQDGIKLILKIFRL
jgi:hypothetical protein